MNMRNEPITEYGFQIAMPSASSNTLATRSPAVVRRANRSRVVLTPYPQACGSQAERSATCSRLSVNLRWPGLPPDQGVHGEGERHSYEPGVSPRVAVEVDCGRHREQQGHEDTGSSETRLLDAHAQHCTAKS